MSYLLLMQTLTESFNALANEVQTLTDRKTILEHKLRYAHEQVGVLTFVCLLLCLSSAPLYDEQPLALDLELRVPSLQQGRYLLPLSEYNIHTRILPIKTASFPP